MLQSDIYRRPTIVTTAFPSLSNSISISLCLSLYIAKCRAKFHLALRLGSILRCIWLRLRVLLLQLMWLSIYDDAAASAAAAGGNTGKLPHTQCVCSSMWQVASCVNIVASIFGVDCARFAVMSGTLALCGSECVCVWVYGCMCVCVCVRSHSVDCKHNCSQKRK